MKDAGRTNRALRRRYLLALSIIALLILLGQALVQYSLMDQEDDSRIINIAGRQRMLSQRITKCSLILQSSIPANEKQIYEEELRLALGLWVKSHAGLQHGDAEMGLPGKNSLQITSMFKQIEPQFQAIVKSAELIAAEGTVNNSTQAAMRVILNNQADFLKGMDEIVFQYDAEAKQKITTFKQIEVGILLVTFITLLLEALFIFRPAEKHLQHAFVDLEQEKHTVEVTLKKLTATYEELGAIYAKLERSNHLMLESIRYARRIQESLLPNPRALGDAVADIAVRWEPLQVVGGDYYWLQQVDGRCVIVVVDCTGHGVPGALLTTVVSTALERIIRDCKPLLPAAMLEAIDASVRTRLRQDCENSQSDDGLEAAICIYDPDLQTLTYAGAGIPLLVMQNGAVTQVKAAKAILGFGSIRSKAKIVEHVLPVASGTTFYLFTDGAPDHMGGSPRVLLGRKRLAAVLAENREKSLTEQLDAVCDYLESYRGDEHRRDDMTMVAFKPR